MENEKQAPDILAGAHIALFAGAAAAVALAQKYQGDFWPLPQDETAFLENFGKLFAMAFGYYSRNAINQPRQKRPQ